MIEVLSEATGQEFTEARDHFEAQGTRDSLVELSGVLRTIAVGLTKICNDLRWMSSGPTTGLAEIHLPDLQPGSSIMPGKVNPVLPEATLMVCFQVVGNDAAVAAAGASGSFELNVAMPVMARNVLESIRLLAAASRLLAERCVDGITADAERMRTYAESSPSVVTPLNKYIGYEAAAKVAKQALADGATIRETVLELGFVERGELTEEQLDEALDVESMTRAREPRLRSVPAVALAVAPGAAGRAVAVLDVAEAPADLGDRVGRPVGAGRGHLGAGQRLRDAVAPRSWGCRRRRSSATRAPTGSRGSRTGSRRSRTRPAGPGRSCAGPRRRGPRCG